jgi:hypothetical protein
VNIPAGAIALAVAASGATALAADPPAVPGGLEGAALLDARAPMFAAIHPTELGDGFALLDLVSGIFPEATRATSRVRDGLGFYSLSAGEFKESGVDPNAVVLASFGLVDGDDAPARKGARPYVRHRFVIRMLDDERFLRAALAVLSSNQASVASFVFVEGSDEPAVPAWAAGRETRALARRTGLALLARLRGGALVAVRCPGDFAVVDYVDAARAGGAPGGRGETRAERAEIAAVLARVLAPPPHALAEALARGARATLATRDVSAALVLEPDALGPLFARAGCGKDWSASDGALFDDAAVLVRLHPFQWHLELVWGLSALGRGRLASMASDDGLLDAQVVAGDGVAAGGLLLDAFGAVRGAPRPPVLAEGFDRAARALDACGPLGWVAAGARFWPQLAAVGVERLISSLEAKGKGNGTTTAPAPLLGHLRNVAAVLRRLPGGGRGWDESTVLLGSLPAGEEPAVTDALARRASGHEVQAYGARTPTVFDLSAATGFSEAGLERIAGAHLALALTPEAAGLGWYYRLPRRPARLGPQTKIGYLHLNLGQLLESWAAGADAATRAAVHLAAGQLGELGGNMVVDGELVRLDLNLSPRP